MGPTASSEGPPYRVVIDALGCVACRHGQTYTVLGPDGAVLGQSWTEQSEAEWMADKLNEAYMDGRIAAGAPEH